MVFPISVLINDAKFLAFFNESLDKSIWVLVLSRLLYIIGSHLIS